jgi:hypothetical protein
MRAAILGAVILLGACGGGGGGYDGGGSGSGGALPTYSVGGMVSGLQGGKTLVLRNNSSTGSDDLTISANGPFTFASQLAYGMNSYSIVVATQPTGQTCTVANGSGTNAGSNITNVAVTCT